MNEPHNLTWGVLAQARGLDVVRDQGVGAGDGDDVGVDDRFRGGIIHGAPAGSKVGCCGNHRCVHGRTA